MTIKTTYRQLLAKSEKEALERKLSVEGVRRIMIETSELQPYQFYTSLDEEIHTHVGEHFPRLFSLYLEGMPLEYILGYAYFFGRRFRVNPNVLIPRPETEELVKIFLNKLSMFEGKDQITVVDIGTGSGVIANTIKCEKPDIIVKAVDISSRAIDVAKMNASILGAEVDFIDGDMLQPLIEKNIKVDAIISNPPYISPNESLDESVRKYEPEVALFAQENGFLFYREILKNAEKVLNKPGLICFEIGYQQKSGLEQIIGEYLPEATYKILKDSYNKDRIAIIEVL